jgi:tryptophan-rich sensory protein
MYMKNVGMLLLFVIGCELVGIVGSVFTISAIPTWYAGLNKPFFSPPNWLFGPVWTLLYFLMGISIFLIWKKGWNKKKIHAAGTTFLIQLALNFVWTPVFFGLRLPLLGLVIIVALWAWIIMTIRAFYPLSKIAAGLLIPYLLWVSFATLLNGGIVFLN